MTTQGLFREDLYYRLNVITLRIPPLRTRDADILALADHFATGYEVILTSEAKQVLLDYTWPGNARELKHTIERATYMQNSSNNSMNTVTESILLTALYGSTEKRRALIGTNGVSAGVSEGATVPSKKSKTAAMHEQVRDIYNSMPEGNAIVGSRIREIADAVYGGLLLQVLVTHDFNFSAAARALQMDRVTMRRWLVAKGLYRSWMGETGPTIKNSLSSKYKEE
jgi:DNA-binding NtrC family response regulator